MKATSGVRSVSIVAWTLRVLSILGLVLVTTASWGGVRLTGENGPTSGWDMSRRPSGVPYLIGTDLGGDGTADLPGDGEIQIIQEAFQAWADVETAAVSYQFLGTGPLAPGPIDSVNTVGFDSDSPWARAGVLAVALTTLRDDEIVEADIVLFDSPTIRWTDTGPHRPVTSALGVSDFNLGEVVTREIGHFNGLHASFLRTPYSDPVLLAENGIVYLDGRDGPFASTGLMYPLALSGSPGASLSTDEIAAISSLYPAGSFSADSGTLSGNVLLRDYLAETLEPLGAANVLAVDPTTNTPVVSTITASDGSYVLRGLPPGGYWVYVEPSSPDDLAGLYPDICDAPIDFFPQFHGGVSYSNRESAAVTSLSAGAGVTGVDVTVTRIVPSSEVVYALGGQTDSEGARLVAKLEPDDIPAFANDLNDDNGDGVIIVIDTLQAVGDVDCFAFQARVDETFLIEVESAAIDLVIPQFTLIGPGLAGSQIGEIAVGDETQPATMTFTAARTDDYFVCISNVLGTGGVDHMYTLTIRRLSGRVSLRPLSAPTAVLSLPIGDALAQDELGLPDDFFGNIEITSLSVQFLDVDGDAGLDTDGSDFLPPTTGIDGVIGAPLSGFSLYRDDGSVPGAFDFDATNPDPSTQDRIVLLATKPVVQSIGNGFEVTFTPEDPLRIPAELIMDDLADFHVVVQTSETFHHGDDFQVIIPPDGIQLTIFFTDPRTPLGDTLFAEAFPPVVERDTFTGDLITLTTFLPDANANMDARSNDFPVIGIDAVGDRNEQYWLSEVEVTFVGYNLANVFPFTAFFGGFFGGIFGGDFTFSDFGADTWDLTDLLPLTDGDNNSGGVNLYKDNNGDGVPDVGLSGDLLLPLEGTRRFEIVDVDTIPDDIIVDLLHPTFLFAEGFVFPATEVLEATFEIGDGIIITVSRVVTTEFFGVPRTLLTEEEFLALKDFLNIFAFKAILPLRPNSALAIPPNNTGENLGSDFFVTTRTSNTVRALDAFIPYIQEGGIKLRNNLQDVLATGDPSFSSLATERSLSRIDTTTVPGTTLVEVRPNTEIALKDLVNSSDPNNRGAIIGSASEGSPPLGIIGIDAMDFYSDASRTLHGPTSNIPSPSDLLNTGGVLEAMTVFVDPADRPVLLSTDFILPVLAQSLTDPDSLSIPRSGLSIHVDDGTPIGNFLDDDGDFLFDEELIDQTDNDLDGFTDEPDVGDEDGTGTQGRLDPADDIIAYIQFNDFTRSHQDVETGVIQTVNELAVPPTVTLTPTGSLQVAFPSLRTNVLCESAIAEVLISDPFSPSIFSDSVFVRVDHPVIRIDQQDPSPCDGPGWDPVGENQIGFFADGGDDPVLEWLLMDEDAIGIEWNYQYMTQIPNSNAIPELLGSDFFVSLRVGPGAQSGDNFRVRIPNRGITVSSYRDISRELVRQRSIPPLDFTSSKILVGTDNIPPTLQFVTPVGGANVATAVSREGRLEFEFEVSFLFADPDNEALVDFFFDDNGFGVDGEPIPVVGVDQTANIPDNDGQEVLQFTFRFPPELANSINPEVFIYGIINDNVNPPRAVYSPFPIVISADDRERLNLQDFLIADNRGRLFGTGGANANIPDFDQRTNKIRDFELTPTGRGGLYLTDIGEVVLRGDPSPWRDFVRTSNRVTFPEDNAVTMPMDFARDVEPDFRRNGYYLLGGDGTVYPVGALPPPAFQFPLVALFPGEDIARDMELTATGFGLLILAEDGQLKSLGDAPGLDGMALGFDAARDLALTASSNGAYILDAFGIIHFLGDANRDIIRSSIPVFFGSDVYRAIEVTPDGEGLLVMDREGQVFPAGEVTVGPNVVEPGVVPLPLGIGPNEEIEFVAPSNFVVNEADGAFIDLETIGLGALAQTAAAFVGSATAGLCPHVLREDLGGLLSLFAPDFEDAQGHDLDDLAETWRAFFDYFIVTACSISEASLTVSESLEGEGGVIVEGFMEVLVMDPTLTTFQVGDDPTALEQEDVFDPTLPFSEIGTAAELLIDGVLFDQTARFWEIGDGRGWHLNIIDDDYVEGQIDPADRVLAQRDFFKRRAARSREGSGSVFFAKERGGDSLNSDYIFQFIEYAEASATDPSGGWFGPILSVLWYDELTGIGSADDAAAPLSLIEFPFSFNVEFDPESGRGLITGGECAVFGSSQDSTIDVTILEQDTGDTTITDSAPSGWRFFGPAGIRADGRFEGLLESHFYIEGEAGGIIQMPQTVDGSNSAYIVNLTQLLLDSAGEPSDTSIIVANAPDISLGIRGLHEVFFGGSIPNTEFSDFIPLPDSLEITPENVQRIPLTEFLPSAPINLIDLIDLQTGGNVGTAVTDDFLVTFSADEQGGVTDRLTYATFRIKSIVPEGEFNNILATTVFTWRYNPETDFIPFNAFKGKIPTASGKIPATGSGQKPNFHDNIKPNFSEVRKKIRN